MIFVEETILVVRPVMIACCKVFVTHLWCLHRDFYKPQAVWYPVIVYLVHSIKLWKSWFNCGSADFSFKDVILAGWVLVLFLIHKSVNIQQTKTFISPEALPVLTSSILETHRIYMIVCHSSELTQEPNWQLNTNFKLKPH